MLDLLLPRTLDNTYRGRRLALWLLALIVFMKLAMSLNSIFNGWAVASSADGIPLDSYSPAAAQTVVALFAIFGLAHLTICAVCVMVLVRYRTLVPVMFSLLLLEQLARKLVLLILPPERVGTPPGFYVNILLLGLMTAGLTLSLPSRKDRRDPTPFQATQ
jgi:hypothetical protein